MIPHRNPSFLIDKSSPKQIKTPGSPPGVFIWGQPSAAGVTPHCAGAASLRRSLSEPWLISPDRFHEILRSRSFRNMRSRYGRPGTAVSSGRLPSPPLCRRVLPAHAKRPRTMAGSFSIPAGAGSAALLQAVDGEGIEPKALIKLESCFIAVGHTEFPGVRPPPLCPPGTSRPRKKTPHGGGVFFYSGRSRISCASAGSQW